MPVKILCRGVENRGCGYKAILNDLIEAHHCIQRHEKKVHKGKKCQIIIYDNRTFKEKQYYDKRVDDPRFIRIFRTNPMTLLKRIEKRARVSGR